MYIMYIYALFIVRSHISWREERNILHKSVETSY